MRLFSLQQGYSSPRHVRNAITDNPGNIAHYLAAMARLEWTADPELRKWMGDELETIGNAWWMEVKKGTVTNQSTDEMVGKIKPLIEKIVIRFTPLSDFLGNGRLIDAPPCIYEEIACHMEPKWMELLTKYTTRREEEYQAGEAVRRHEWNIRYPGRQSEYVPAQRPKEHFYQKRLYNNYPGLLEIQRETAIRI